MTCLDERLTNDQKLRLMDMATRMVSSRVFPRIGEGYEAVYKKMIDLVTTHNPEKEVL